MKLTRLWVPALLVLMGISLWTAQDSIRLRFEVYRNGVLVANPEASVTSGSAARFAMDGIGTIVFTPTSRDSDSVSIAFDIDAGGRQSHPVLKLRGNDPGELSWSSTAGSETFKITVMWVR